ncbi:MAG: hypothetical protein ACWA47_09025 [Brevirhabdus sp.]
MRHFLASLLALISLPALAQDLMSAAEFEAYVTGKTIAYDRGGAAFGEEQYYPDRKVIWAFDGDVCTFGEWYPSRGYICFAYDGRDDDQCWSFWLSNGRLAALVEGGGADSVLYGTRETEAHIACPLPGLGT